MKRWPLLHGVELPAEPPSLPERGAGEPDRADGIVGVRLIEAADCALRFEATTGSGASIRLEYALVAPGVVRVSAALPGSSSRPRLARPLVPYDGRPTCEAGGGRATLGDDLIAVSVSSDPFQVEIDVASAPALRQNSWETNVAGAPRVLPFGLTREDGLVLAWHETFDLAPDEHVFGFGEKFTGLSQRGRRLEMWNYDPLGVQDEKAYKNVPFFLSNQGYGMFVDSPTAVVFDMGASNQSTFTVIVPDESLEYYVLAGPEPSRIVERYAALVGYPPLPPKWAFGFWISSGYQADTGSAAVERARAFRERDILADVSHLDAHWQRPRRWSDFVWDTDAFPDPAGTVAELKALGFHVSLWLSPYVSVESERFAEAERGGFLLRCEDGETYVGQQWAGTQPEVGIIDFTNPEAVRWFQRILAGLLDLGIDVFKTDLGEGVPASTRGHDGTPGTHLHNVYPLLYNDAVAEVTARETGRTGLVWTRSSFAGGQRHAAQWGGDPHSTFAGMAATLRGGLSISLCGHAFWSHDIGGLYGAPSPDLFVRWAQFGLLSPLSRTHGTTTRFPWDFGEEVERIFRTFVRLRYSLLPYLYSYANTAARTGLPIMRPLLLEFPDDPVTASLDLQYMLGSELLVAPVFRADGRSAVYLPEGDWFGFFDGQQVRGPTTVRRTVPLDTVPLYVRADSLIPTAPPAAPIADGPFCEVTFVGWLLGSAAFELHDDDGTTRVAAAVDGDAVDVSVSGAKRTVAISLRPTGPVVVARRVSLDGAPLDGWRRLPDGGIEIVVGDRDRHG